MDNQVNRIDELSKQLNFNIKESIIEIAQRGQASIVGEISKFDCGDNQINVFRSRLLKKFREHNKEESRLYHEALNKMIEYFETCMPFNTVVELRKDLLNKFKLYFENKLTEYTIVIEFFIRDCVETKTIDLNKFAEQLKAGHYPILKLPQDIIDVWPKFFKWCVVTVKPEELEELLPRQMVGGTGEVIGKDDPRHPKYGE